MSVHRPATAVAYAQRLIPLSRAIIMLLITLAVALVLLAPQYSRGGEIKRVVTSVTTDDVNRAAMAIAFTKSIMQEKNVEGVLFFNVYGVNLVNANKTSPTYDGGRNIAAMLEDFMQAGGTVIACPMCMQHVGHMTSADLMQGVVAVKGGGVKAITEPDTLALSY